MKRVIQLILLALIVVLAVLLVQGIQKPIDFNNEKDARYKKVVSKLIEIRNAELAYKSVKGKFTGDWDSLIHVVRTDSFPVVKKSGQVPEEMTEKQALEAGIVRRDTIRVSMLDSLFKTTSVDSLKFVPGIKDSVFSLAAKQLQTGSGMIVPAFEAKVHNKTILKGMDKQLIINLNADAEMLEKYPGLKVGSLDEASTAGNWESL